MRIVLQRVTRASVSVEGRAVSEIGPGLLVLLGVAQDDSESDADYLADKVANIRIFSDEADKMNLSVLDVRGQALVVSQFTLLADVRKGRRPGFTDTCEPARAKDLYLLFCRKLSDVGVSVAQGTFQAMMDVSLVNSGPVTILLDSRKQF